MLIEQQASETFDPSHYTDDVRARIEAAMQKKVEGQEITLAEAPQDGGAQVIDLMEALRAARARRRLHPPRPRAPEEPVREHASPPSARSRPSPRRAKPPDRK